MLNSIATSCLEGPALYPKVVAPDRPEFAMMPLQPVNERHPHYEHVGFDYHKWRKQQSAAAGSSMTSRSVPSRSVPSSSVPSSSGAATSSSAASSSSGAGSSRDAAAIDPAAPKPEDTLGWRVATPTTHFGVPGADR